MTLPAYLQQLPSRNLAQTAIANVGAGNPPYLSIEGNRFTLIDAAGNTIPIETLHVDAVIVDVNPHISKIYFPDSYSRDNPSPPICFSDNGVAPSRNAGTPQAPTCASCRNNEWGSKISQMGSKVKACTDQQKIAIILPQYPQHVFLLRIPPGSFQNWRAYNAKFLNSGVELDWVVTRIAFEQGVMGTLTFASPGYIDQQMVPVIQKAIEAKLTDAMIGKLDQPREVTAQIQYHAPAQLAPQEYAPSPLPQGASVPNAASQPMPTGTPAQQQPASPSFATPAGASPTEPQRRRRGRQPAAQAQPAPNGGPLQPGPQMAPFRPEAQQVPFGQVGGAANIQPSGQGQFGIVQNPQAPPAGLDLDAVFK